MTRLGQTQTENGKKHLFFFSTWAGSTVLLMTIADLVNLQRVDVVSAVAHLEEEVDHGQVVLRGVLLVRGRVEVVRIDGAAGQAGLDLRRRRREFGSMDPKKTQPRDIVFHICTMRNVPTIRV